MDAASRESLTRSAVVALGVYQLALAAFQAFLPEEFFEYVGPYAVFNQHYLQDVAAYEAALGVAALIAVGRVAWRAPVLTLAAFHYGFHSISHVVDMGESDPGWIGPVEAVALVLATAGLAWLARLAAGTSARP